MICGSETTFFLHPKTAIGFSCCDNCGYIRKHESAFPSPEEEKRIYLQHQNSLEKQDYVDYLKKFIDSALIPFVAKAKIVGLDFGSGPVPVLKEILHRDYGFETVSYDPFFDPDESYQSLEYDFIVSTEVFEHLREPLVVFNKLTAMLRPGGVLAIMTLFHPNDKDKFLDWWYIRDKTHIGFFLPKTFSEMARLTEVEFIYTDRYRYVTIRKKQG